MTDSEKLAWKQKLKALLLQLVEQRLQEAIAAANEAQEAANSEEKSSAGDKYETGRAMGHLQKDMHAARMASVKNELAQINAVDCTRILTHIAPGAFIDTGKVCIFIAGAAAKQMVDQRAVLFISPQSPLAKTLFGKREGDSFTMGNDNYLVEMLC